MTDEIKEGDTVVVGRRLRDELGRELFKCGELATVVETEQSKSIGGIHEWYYKIKNKNGLKIWVSEVKVEKVAYR